MHKRLLLAGLLSLVGLALNARECYAFFWHCHHCCTKICCRPYNAFTPICWGNLVCDGCCPNPCGVAGGCFPTPYMCGLSPWACCGPSLCCPPPPCCPPSGCCPDGGCAPGHQGPGPYGPGPNGPPSNVPLPPPANRPATIPDTTPAPGPESTRYYAPYYYNPAAYGMNPYYYGYNPYAVSPAAYYPGYYAGYNVSPVNYNPMWSYGQAPAYWYGAGQGQ